MTKEEYLEQLRYKLRKLPKEEFDKAIDYFEEYFADAGEENTAQAIENLGSPQVAADQIITELAIDNSSSKAAKNNVKKGFNGVWIVILAIFASPIALPIVISVVTLLLAFVIVVVALLAAFGLTGIAFSISAPVALIGGFTTMIHSFPVALVCFGLGLFFLAIGVLIVYASYLLLRRFLYWIVVIFGKKFARGGKKDEK